MTTTVQCSSWSEEYGVTTSVPEIKKAIKPSSQKTSQPKSPSSDPKSPPSVPKTTSSVPKTPSSVPKTPSSVPKTPSSVPKTPSSVPKSPSSVSKPATSAPKTPSSASKTTSSASKTPSSVPKTPSSVPKTPSSVPKPATSAPKTPSSVPKPPATSVVKTPTSQKAQPAKKVATTDSNSWATPFMRTVLDEHNRYRARHSAPPLTLNPVMCRYSQEWANHMAQRGTMYHRPNNRYTENIFSWPGRTTLSGKEVVKNWYDEVRYYRFGLPTPPNFFQVGHFTQVVWKGSRQLGVGVAHNGRSIYVSCNYDPLGNCTGRYAANVSAN